MQKLLPYLAAVSLLTGCADNNKAQPPIIKPEQASHIPQSEKTRQEILKSYRLLLDSSDKPGVHLELPTGEKVTIDTVARYINPEKGFDKRPHLATVGDANGRNYYDLEGDGIIDDGVGLKPLPISGDDEVAKKVSGILKKFLPVTNPPAELEALGGCQPLRRG